MKWDINHIFYSIFRPCYKRHVHETSLRVGQILIFSNIFMSFLTTLVNNNEFNTQYWTVKTVRMFPLIRCNIQYLWSLEIQRTKLFLFLIYLYDTVSYIYIFLSDFLHDFCCFMSNIKWYIFSCLCFCTLIFDSEWLRGRLLLYH